jgi:hypothetical protein
MRSLLYIFPEVGLHGPGSGAARSAQMVVVAGPAGRLHGRSLMDSLGETGALVHHCLAASAGVPRAKVGC